MPTSNPLDILVIHNEWATRQLLEACTKLTDEQFHQRFEMGPGSLHDTTTHLLGALRSWTDMLAQREPRPRLDQDGVRRSPAQLLELLAEIAADFSATAHAHPLDEMITAVRGGKSYSFTRGGVITHVTTHGMHHRAQCLNMLRHVGVSPLPSSSVLEWMLKADNNSQNPS